MGFTSNVNNPPSGHAMPETHRSRQKAPSQGPRDRVIALSVTQEANDEAVEMKQVRPTGNVKRQLPPGISSPAVNS